MIALVLVLVFIFSLTLYYIPICSGPHNHSRRLGNIALCAMERLVTSIDPELCYEMLEITDRVCQKHNVQFWLAEGTALGATRDKSIIPYDSDVDISMWPQYWETFHDVVVPELVSEHGFIVYKDHAHYDFMTLRYKGQYLDINSIVAGSYCSAIPGPCDDIIPHIEPLVQVTLNGKTYMSPSEKYLLFLYGPTWKTPIPNLKPSDIHHNKPPFQQ